MFKQTYYGEIPSRENEVHWSSTYELENNNCKNFSVTIDYNGGVAPFYTIKQGRYSCPVAPVHVEELIKILSLTYKDKSGETVRKLKTNENLDNLVGTETNGTIQED